MTNRTYHRTADLVRALLVMKKDDMDDDYMIESRLVPIFDIPYSVLRLEDDNYYGSAGGINMIFHASRMCF